MHESKYQRLVIVNIIVNPSHSASLHLAMSRDTAVVLFARLPVPGKAKTRLAKDVGLEAAAEFYRTMAERSFGATASSSRASSRTLFFSDGSEAEGIAQWVRAIGDDSLRLASQCDSPDLGERMRHALNRALECGGVDGGRCEKAIVVGTDVPDLSAVHIDAAARALDDHDVVFGPAVDGGYYLLGVRRRKSDGNSDDTTVEKALFQGIPWSTSTVLRDSLVAARTAGLATAPETTLPQLIDVDLIDDVKAWIANAPVDDADSFRQAAAALTAGEHVGGRAANS